MPRSVVRTALKVVTEIGLWLALVIITFLLAYNSINVEPTRRGFFCDDESIQYPYKDDTVSDALAAVIFVLIPIIIMIIIETIHVLSSKERKARGRFALARTILVKTYRTVGAFLFTCIATMFLTETSKLFAGRLRPHFISVCSPDFSAINCSQGYIVISDDLCTSTATKAKLLDARKSFPSGHSSITACGAVYVIIYLHIRFIWLKKVRNLLPFLQVGVACAATFVCISRVSDNKHHFSDVIAGAILGTVVALLMARFLSCLPKYAKLDDYALNETKANVSLQRISASNQSSVSTVVDMKDT